MTCTRYAPRVIRVPYGRYGRSFSKLAGKRDKKEGLSGYPIGGAPPFSHQWLKTSVRAVRNRNPPSYRRCAASFVHFVDVFDALRGAKIDEPERAEDERRTYVGTELLSQCTHAKFL